MDRKELTETIHRSALELGFSACGFAKAEPVDEDVSKTLECWIANGMNGCMQYMANYADKRNDPRLLVEGAKSVISVALNYFPKRLQPDSTFRFAKYAYGKDYHDVMKMLLMQLFEKIRLLQPDVEGRIFCDTAPVLERYWAWRCGLGWIGRNTSLIIPGAGSYFFLGEIICNKEFDYDTPQPNRCGSCHKCLDSCPTGALCSGCVLDANLCLSCQTIENRGELSESAVNAMGNRIYGCDTCQDVCPWNRFAAPTEIEEFAPSEQFISMTKEQWESLSVEEYRLLFKGSAVKRAKFEGLVRNIKAASRNSHD